MDIDYTNKLPPLLPPATLQQAQSHPLFLGRADARQNGGDSIQYQSAANPQTSTRSQGLQACQRCRQQKLRCSRESPICKRCQRAFADCVYPPPPDRKLLAAQRVRKSTFRPYAELRTSTARDERVGQLDKGPESAEERILPNEARSDSINGPDFAQGNDARDHSPWIAPPILPPSNGLPNPTLKLAPVPSPEVARLLIEMYFTRVYNATLLFHKETFLADYAANKLPTFMINAIFALSSIFLPTPSTDSRIDDWETDLGISALSTSDFGTFAHQWATAATQQVLLQSTKLSIQTIQACQVLTLYWFSKDARDQVHVLSSLAYTSCRLMGFHVPRVEAVVDDELGAEMRRRCFWSSWMTACISQENAPFRNESWNEVVGLPFPADEASFASGKPELVEAFDENGRIVPYGQANGPKQTSIMGELMKLVSLWWQISHFVRTHQDKLSYNSPNRLLEFLKLDRRLEHFSENLHSNFKYSGPSSFASTKLDSYSLFSMQCLYRLCACALHSSLVPLFSSTSPDPEISKKLVRLCAEEAVRHSVIILDMASAFLNTRPDISRLSSMTGYAMFVASAVQIRSLGAQGKLKTHSVHLKASVTILRNLNEYWSPLRGLWIKLVVISSFAGLDVESFSVSREEYQTTPASMQTNIAQIISPEAVSESGPGTDIYTYVGRSEPGAVSQQSSPAHAGSQSATEQVCRSPTDRSNASVARQMERGERPTTDQSQNGINRTTQVIPTSDVSFPFPNSSSEKVAGQRKFQASLDRDLNDGNSHHPRAADAMDLYMAGSNPQPQPYSLSINRQTRPSQQSETIRPMMDGFDSVNGMMGIDMGMDMDLGSEEDDFWWTRSWGSVRIL